MIKTEIKKNKSLILSKIGFTEMQEITTFLQLEINVIDWKPKQDTVSTTVPTVTPFIWDKKLNENKQYKEYKDHLSKLLHLPSTMEWYHAKDNQQFLTVTDSAWLPFSIKGTSDLAILNFNYSRTKGQEAKGARILFELKKDGTIGAQERYQAQVELILANHWSKYFVLVVLTDLVDYWEFMWENGNEIYIYFATQDLAVRMIQEYINRESQGSQEDRNIHSRSDEFDDEYPLSKRRKLNTSTMNSNDIANFCDFADEMTETQLDQKIIERFLRDIYIPSSPYSQLINTESPSYIT
ncbi:hypothetical protein RclHR1_11650006 [Rhizophagus clarus]|nr:hypothetical protein RclHR1_11650006 [Rhizophagus clarus]